VDDVAAGDTNNGHEQKTDSVKMRWKCDSFAANHQIPCPLKNAKFIVVCYPGLKLQRTMNARNLVHALTPHYTKLYVSCQSHFYFLKPGVDDAFFQYYLAPTRDVVQETDMLIPY